MSKQSRSKKAPKRTKNPVERLYKSLSTEQMIIVGTVAITLLIVGVITLNSSNNRKTVIGEVERVPVLSSGHTEDQNEDDGEHGHEEDIARFDEDGLPPAGGSHYATWLNCGIYDEPVPTGNTLHSLEHGAVWITYHPDLAAEEVEKLREVTRGSSRRILSPYPDLAAPIVVTAWGYRLRLDDADDDRLRQFIRNYEDGSGAPEPGASCSRGVGEPLR